MMRGSMMRGSMMRGSMMRGSMMRGSMRGSMMRGSMRGSMMRGFTVNVHSGTGIYIRNNLGFCEVCRELTAEGLLIIS